jgi:simple sugar transport system ATP-binding protein
MHNISKRFGSVVALREASFRAWSGEIHALLGENGAGKTSLMNVLSGLYRADAGEIHIAGRPVRMETPRDAVELGIGMVHQHVELVPHLSVLENILLGQEGGGWRLDLESRREKVEEVARAIGLAVDLSAPVRRLGVGDQQRVEILRVLHRGAEILILDEPTALLTPQEVTHLFASLRALSSAGRSVIFITHKIAEVLAHCDRITIMRAGALVASLERSEADPERLVEAVMGQRTIERAARTRDGSQPAVAKPLLGVEGLRAARARRTGGLVDVGLVVGAGDVVGVAGVTGSGQRDLAEALLGIQAVEAGRITLAGEDITRAGIRERLARGLLYIPEDRLADGLLPKHSVARNLILGPHRFFPERRRLFARPARLHDLARRLIHGYGITPGTEALPAATLSGGNQQKLLMARALTLGELVGGKLVVAMNPTRGLDVGSADFVHRRLLGFAEQGGAVLLVSADLDELMVLCDRIVVMYAGRIAGALARKDFDAVAIGRLMTGTPPGGTS